jgi:hypothetical protein
MPTSIVLKVIAPNITELLNLGFDRIKIKRSVAGEDGPFVEITTPATRPVLLENKTTYTFVDGAGETTYYYVSTYFNSTTTEESSASDPITGEGEPALDVLSIDELKTNYLFGLDLTDDNGNPMPDDLFIHYIRTAVSRLEHELDLSVAPKVLQDVNRFDFIRPEYYKYIWIGLEEYPIISVDAVRLVLPTEQQVINFDPSWFQLDKESGQLMIIPGNGQLSTVVLGQSGAWLPLVYGWDDFIPDVFRVDYVVGFEKGKIPHMIKDVIGKWASMGPLNLAGDLISGAGIASKSISMDGLSQSVATTSSATNAGFGARLIQYTKEIKETLPLLRRYYKGIRVRVI